jgi:hypothetical protein
VEGSGLRGKSWPVEEERQLRELASKGVSIDEIAQIMGKTRLSIRGKMNNLRLTVFVAATPQGTAATTTRTTTPANILSEVPSHSPAVAEGASQVDAVAPQPQSTGALPTIEEQLHVLNAAIVALRRPGISRVEVARYSKIIDGVKVYNDLFAKFVDYRGLEIKVLELEKLLACEKNP